MVGDGEKDKERGLASRSHILRLDIAERSFVSSAKLGYGSAVCLEKGDPGGGRGGGKRDSKCARVSLDVLIIIERLMTSRITNNET